MSDKQVNGMFDVSQELNAGYTFTKTQIAELEALRKENAALLVAIEAKDAALAKLLPTLLNWMYQEEASYGKNFSGSRTDKARELVAKTRKGLALSPSTELLEARDRKRDAKLLRLFAKDFSSNIQEHANMSAIFRESGEWTPELGD